MLTFKDRFNSLSLESQIVCLICGFGTISVFIVVIVDLLRPVQYAELVVDTLILITLSSLTYLSWTQSVQRISVVFGIFLSVLLALNFLQFGGSSGYMKFNYYTGLYIIILVYSFRKLVITVTFHLLLLLIIIILDYINHPIKEKLFISSSPGAIDFWFTIVIISVFTYYLKQLTDTYSGNLSVLNNDMANRIREARSLKRLLNEKNGELKKARQQLESEINRRSEVLNRKNQAIEKFLKVNTMELVEPVQELIDVTQNISGTSPLSELLKKSSGDLAAISNSIREAIELEQTVHRKNISQP